METRFVLGFLRTGLAATAAREAGYSDPEADAAKIRKRPKVAAVLTQVATAAAGNATALVRRVWERSQATHADWQIARNKPDGLRSTKEEAELLSAANTTDKLLGSLLGMDQLNISGAVAINHTIPPELQEHLLMLQRGMRDLEDAA